MFYSTANLGRSGFQPGDVILKVSFGVKRSDVDYISKVKVKALRKLMGFRAPNLQHDTLALGHRHTLWKTLPAEHIDTLALGHRHTLWKSLPALGHRHTPWKPLPVGHIDTLILGHRHTPWKHHPVATYQHIGIGTQAHTWNCCDTS